MTEFKRDDKSKALINTDIEALNQRRLERDRENRLNNIEERLERIEKIIGELVNG